MLTRLMMDKIHNVPEGITGDNGKHAVSTQPLLFSNHSNENEEHERAEWDWIKRK